MNNPYTKEVTNRIVENGTMDVYDVLKAFNVTDQKLGHSIKKLLVPGGRTGGKSYIQDLKEAHWTLGEAILEETLGMDIEELPNVDMEKL